MLDKNIEIEKLYENANVRKYWNSTPDYGIEEYYPPFTKDKQLELIKWISRKEGFRADKSSIEFGIYATDYAPDFETALAKAVNCFLEYCSSEEKQNIKEILE